MTDTLEVRGRHENETDVGFAPVTPAGPVFGATLKTRRERVLILGRTRAGEMLCVGGMTDALTNIRLKRDEQPPHWYAEACPFHVGDVFQVICSDSLDPESPHHREDVLTHVWEYEKTLDWHEVKAIIMRSKQVRRGPEPWLAFKPKNGAAPYFRLSEKGSWVIPKQQLVKVQHSIGFWRPTIDLVYQNRYYWGESQSRKFRIPFVGAMKPKQVLPAGTLVRLSTSGFFKPINGAALQLSGWFL